MDAKTIAVIVLVAVFAVAVVAAMIYMNRPPKDKSPDGDARKR